MVTFATADTSTAACGASSVPVICKPTGWSGAGVARASSWRTVWHAQVPGLERQGGTLTRQADGQLLFTMPGVDTSRWTDPSINDPLMVGDSVAVEAYSLADPNATLCAELTNENLNPLSREFLITAIGPDFFVLSPGSTQVLSGDTGFAPPDSCLPVGATVEVHYGGLPGGTPSWLVIQGNLIHGRATNGQQFVATETRFDYPLQYTYYPDAQDDAALLPTIANDIGVAFTISGTEPITAQSTLSWSIASGQSPTRVLDTGAQGGFAGAVITYTSVKIPGNLVFFSSTGSNSVVQIDPASIGVTNGVVSYR